MKINLENLKKYDWDSPILGDVTKQNIRDLIAEIYPDDIFGTPAYDWYKIQDDGNIKLKIELSNGYDEIISKELGKKMAKKLSEKAGYPFKFVRHTKRTYEEDMHGYEPTKIAPGTYATVTDHYVILQSNIDNYLMKFESIVEITEYYDGGPNDKGNQIGFMKVSKSMFDIGTTFGKPALVINDKFKTAFYTRYQTAWIGNYGWNFVTKEKYTEELEYAKAKLTSLKL